MKRILAALGVAALVGTGVAVAAVSPASAHDAGATPNVSCLPDGSATVTWTIGNDWGTKFVVIKSEGTAGPKNGTQVEAHGSTTVTENIAAPAAGSVSTVDFWANWTKDNFKRHITASATVPESCTVPTPTPEPPKTVITPHIQDYLPGTKCLAAPNSRVAGFVLDNLGSTEAVTYTINGEPYVVEAGKARHVDGLPVADAGTTFHITAADKTWDFTAQPEDDSTCTYDPYIQTYFQCLADNTASNAFVLDNTGSWREETYTVVGADTHVYKVAGGAALHTDADGTNLVPDADGNFTVTTNHGTPHWTNPLKGKTAADCAPVIVTPEVVTPLPPTFDDFCGIDKDQFQVPDDTEQVTYTVDDQRKDGVGVVEVTAHAAEGFAFPKGEDDTTDTLTWGHDFTNEPCDTETTPPTTEPTPPVTTEPTPPATTEPTPPVTTPKPEPTPTETPKPGHTDSPKPTHTETPKPSETPKAVAPVVKHNDNGPKSGELAFTGSEGLGYGLAAALVLALAGSGLLIARRRKA